MGRKAIIKTIRSYAIILLLHLIKQQAEKKLLALGMFLFVILSEKFNGKINVVKQVDIT